MTRLNPYLFFNGNCEEAFNFYKTVFGNDFKYFGRYKDVPQADRSLFRENDDKVMHVSLPINSETMLMGSDNAEMYTGPVSTNNFSLYVNADSKDEADRLFNEFSIGGEIDMQMTETFWGSYYGIVTDRFGITWKITFDLDPDQSD